jgi:hypothetical protein
MDTSVVTLPAGVRARIYYDVQDTTNGNATRAHWDGYFDATSGRVSSTVIVNGTADRVLMYIWLENNDGVTAFSGTATVGFTKVLVEPNYSAPYFDGGTQPVLRTNLHPNPIPTSSVNYALVNNATVTYDAATSSIAVMCVTGAADSGIRLHQQTVTTGQPITISTEVEAVTAATWRLNVQLTGQAVQQVSLPPFVAGEIRRVSFTYTPAASGIANIYLLRSSSAGTEVARIRKTQVEFGSVATSYLDGITTKAGFLYSWVGAANASASIEVDGDLSVRWAGTANNSVSELYGTTIVGASSVGAIAFIRSSRWKASGLYSARMIAISATVSVSYASYTIPAPANPSGGTIVITSYQEAPITGSSWAMLGRIYTNPSSTLYVGTQRPNSAGTFEHRLSFGPGQSNFILSHGGTLGSPDIWYDLAMLVADRNYTGPAFTGSTPSKDGVVYRWSAGVDASTSIRETYTISGGLQLNDPQGRWWIARATSPRTPAARRHTAIALPGRDGDYPITREERNSGTYGLVMHIQGSNAAGNFDAAAADRNLSRLLSAMSGEFLMTETLYSADGNPLIRQAYGQILNGVSPTQKPTLKVLEVTMPINLTDGRWMTPAVTQVTPASLTVGIGPIYFYELPGVDAETDDIIIRISNKNNTGRVSVWGGEANARAGGVFGTRTGIFYAATIPASNYVFIDVKNFVAKQTTSAGDWAMQTGTDVTANLDYPPSGKLELSPSYISTLDTSIYVAFIQAEAAATAAAVTIQVRGTYQ